jgi:putative NADH-flavin reductase
LVRDPSKLPEHLQSHIDIIQGDVTNSTDVQQTVEGQDAVVVTLGTRNDLGKLIFTFRKSRIARNT